MQKELTGKARIRFQDCDPLNHLNNGRYIDYFILAREDQVRDAYGLDIHVHMRETGKGWVITSNQVAYLYPAAVNEIVTIKTRLVGFSNNELHVEMTMWDEAETRLKSIAWAKMKYIDLRAVKATDHSDELMELFGSVATPADEKFFEQRCGAIIQQLKAAQPV